MDEKHIKENHCESGRCVTCHGSSSEACVGCWLGKRRLLRALVMVLILMFVFWLGLVLGELKSIIRGEVYGRGAMYRGGYMMAPHYRAKPSMMNQWNEWYPEDADSGLQ